MSSILPLRLISVTWGIVSLLLAFMLLSDLSMLGFPDGYISPYDAATRPLQELMAWLVIAQGAYFVLTGRVAKGLRSAGLLLKIFATGALVFVPINIVETCPRWDICASVYQAVTGNLMDDGTGG
jgi:hypothetical protein